MSTIKSSAENLTLNADGANNDVIIQSNGSTKVTVDGQNSRVGIGTASPDKELHTVNASQSVANRVAYNGSYYTDYGYHQVNTQSNDFVLKTTGTTRMTVKNDTGYIIAATGVTFGTDTAAENALNDYESGTWTPTLTCSSSGSYTLDTGANAAAYTKIGRIVHIQGSIGIASESSPNGNLRMSLPFTSFTGSKDTDNSMGNATLEGHGGSIPNGINIFVFGAAYAQFAFIADNGTFDYLDHSHVDTTFSIKFSFTYIA